MRMLEYYGIDSVMCPVAVKEELRRGNISTPGQQAKPWDPERPLYLLYRTGGEFTIFQTSLLCYPLSTARTWISLCQLSGKHVGWGWESTSAFTEDPIFCEVTQLLHCILDCMELFCSQAGLWEARFRKMLTSPVNKHISKSLWGSHCGPDMLSTH